MPGVLRPGRRSAAFIDAQNLFHWAKERGLVVNYEALRDWLHRRGTWQITVFTVYDPENEGQKAFMRKLGHLGLRVVARPIHGGKPNVDLLMCAEIFECAPSLDEVVLVTGDGDFRCVIDSLARRGKHLVVLGPDEQTSPELILGCHEFVYLSNIPHILKPCVPEAPLTVPAGFGVPG